MRETRTMEQARLELEKMNETFRARKILPEAFYSQIEQRGFQIDSAILVNLVPEGSNTYSGQILSADARLFYFDIDLDSPQMAVWEELETKPKKSSDRVAVALTLLLK